MKKLHKPTSINPSILALFLFFNHSLSLDRYYEACVPKHCGDGRNITYPFFIIGLQQSYCGYPGFELHCSNNGSSILHTPQNNFTILQISPRNRSVRLTNAAVSPVFCPRSINNVTLDLIRFELDADLNSNSNLVFLSKCSALPDSLSRYKIGSCGLDTEMVMVEADENLGVGRGLCHRVVVAPVEGGRSEAVVDGENYVEAMERGFWMRWKAGDCGVCEESGGRCGFNVTDYKFRCFCADRPHKVSCKPVGTKRKLILIIVSAGFATILVLAAVFFMLRRGYRRNLFAYFSSREKSRDLDDASVYFGVPVFSYDELEDATKNFNPSQELGDGGFGTVYYGKLRDGREVAVKRLYEHNYKRVQQFMNEVEILTRLRHRNLVLLYGCTSRRSRELLLVYEYVPNGTVADHLHGEGTGVGPGPGPLMWPVRMNIAIETASALVYLHASDIVHRDVKTSNILLDHSFRVKVADFGLSRLLPNDVTHVSTAPQGTPGYVDPEYHQCYQLTEKSDVYSFGVVLIELISSMPAVDISRSRDEITLANLAINRIQRRAVDELIDPRLGADEETERMTTSVAELAFRCLQFDSEARPTMTEVLEVLKEIQTAAAGDVEGEVENKTPLPPPPPSPENEVVGLLKTLPPSPISVTENWHSNSSRATTPNTSV